MSWTVFMLMGVLIAGAVNAFNWRMLALCIAYAGVYWLVLKSPTLSGSEWYITCALGEIAVIGVAKLLKSRASQTVIWLSMGALVFHICTYFTYLEGSTLFYSIYPFTIRMVEGCQLASLVLFSPLIADTARNWVRRKGHSVWTHMHWPT